jgi:hypothetical protein
MKIEHGRHESYAEGTELVCVCLAGSSGLFCVFRETSVISVF